MQIKNNQKIKEAYKTDRKERSTDKDIIRAEDRTDREQ